MYALREVARSYSRKKSTGKESLIGMQGRALEPFSAEGRVFVDGEIWKAVLPPDGGSLEKDDKVEVTGVRAGLVVEIRRV